MKILSIDTSSDICGVSILENNNLICNLDCNTGRTHSENLMPIIKQAFLNNNLNIKDIDLIVCDKGPGSFTGIRIGIASAKAFTDSLNIPCIGISSLEALAYNLINTSTNDNNKYICSIIDCKKDNCYFALFEKKENTLETLIEPQAENIDSTLAILKSYCEDTLDSNNITFVGDGTLIYKNKIVDVFSDAQFTNTTLNNLNSYTLGLAGLNHYNSNIDIDDVLPLYLKKPQAQKQLEEKMKFNNKTLD